MASHAIVQALEAAIRRRIEVMSNYGLLPQKRRCLKKLFKTFDNDASGFVSRSEFRAALAQINCFGKDVDLLFSHYDVDNSGEISYEEFSALLEFQ